MTIKTAVLRITDTPLQYCYITADFFRKQQRPLRNWQRFLTGPENRIISLSVPAQASQRDWNTGRQTAILQRPELLKRRSFLVGPLPH